jgi:hypothetical protein
VGQEFAHLELAVVVEQDPIAVGELDLAQHEERPVRPGGDPGDAVGTAGAFEDARSPGPPELEASRSHLDVRPAMRREPDGDGVALARALRGPST